MKERKGQRDMSEGANPTSTRRTLLRGLGVSMALPWLESVPFPSAEAAEDSSRGDSEQPPTRTLVNYWCPFTRPGGEKHRGDKVSPPRKQYNKPALRH